MSGYYYPPHSSPPEGDEFDFNQPLPSYLSQHHVQQHAYQNGLEEAMVPLVSPPPVFQQPQHFYSTSQQYPVQGQYQTAQAQPWVTPVVPSNYTYDSQPSVVAFPQYTEPSGFIPETTVAGPSGTYSRYLSPDEADVGRLSRSASFASNASSISQSDVSRSVSPNASEMAKWGHRNSNGTWSCSYPGCSSRSTFNRGCDLRKHYKRHTKSLFCRHEGCPQATEGGFSSKKDRARHEAKHNPMVACDWPGCDRMFSRVDNMKDHVKRMHKQRQAQD